VLLRVKKDMERCYSSEASLMMEDVSRTQRLVHQLFWSSVVKSFSAFHPPEGLSYLLSLGMIKQGERDSPVLRQAIEASVYTVTLFAGALL